MDPQNGDLGYNKNNYYERECPNIAKQYDKEFKLHAVKQVIEQGKPAAQVSRELDIAQQTLSKWLKKYNEDQTEPFVGSGSLRSEDKAMKELEKKLRDLEEENAILKKAMGIFAKDLK
ncbi:transposase [Zhenhengia yiwuensis]|uniref:transposase n=1 Tax=Zhenhengia yiwuensis TaxID=2763666 RepID=UPI002A763EB3|nr:transposase [Zhenhengia yiwuensis]MDY3366890.1 transposase [Zhenhengia yiwuensis]